MWLGGNDIQTPGTYFWQSSGLKVTYTHWSDGEPNDMNHVENCMHMWKDDGTWNDLPCDFINPKQYTFCEKIISCS